MAIFRDRYSRQGLWLLFSACAFPIHVWTLILFFQDIAWITERTNSWDAIGVGAYGLLIAFVESLFVLVIALALGFLIPRHWAENKRIALLGSLAWVTSIWAILNQLYFFFDFRFSENFLRLLLNSGHPLWILYGTALGGGLLTALLPAIGVMKSGKFVETMRAIMERVSTLTGLYLLLDFGGLIVVLIRNL